MLEKFREASKHSRKFVADHRLQQLEYFQAREQLATSRRTHGYDRDDSWMHGTRPLSPEELNQNLWSEVNTLKNAISMPRQKVKNLINAIKQGKVNDEEFAMHKRLVEKRDRDAAYATVAPVDTVQYHSPRSLTPEMPLDVCVSLESNEGKMDPDPTELEPPSAGTYRTAVSPERGDMGDRANHRRRLFARWRGIESGGRHPFTNGMHWYASRYSYDTGKFVKRHLPGGKPQTQELYNQRRKQAI